MADSPISSLVTAGALAGTEALPIVQSSTTKKTTVQDIADLASGSNLGSADLTSTSNTRKFTLNGSLSTNTLVVEAASGADIVQFRGDNVVAIGTGTEILAGISGSALRINSTTAEQGWNVKNSTGTLDILRVDNFGVGMEGRLQFITSGVNHGFINSSVAGTLQFGGSINQKHIFTNNSATPRLTVNCGGAQELAFYDAFNIAFGTSTGTKIGKLTTQKMGFWNTTPIVQPTALTASDATVTDGTIGTADTIINNLRTRLNELEAKLSAAGGGSGLIA